MKTKKLTTPLKIIKILKLMTEKPVSLKEITESLEEDDNFVNRETITKYFTTLRNAGCNIQKKQNKFYIKYPILSFSDTEFKTLADFQKITKNLTSKKDYNEFLKFLDKLFALADTKKLSEYKRILQNTEDKNLVSSNVFKDKIESISNFLTEPLQKIKIIFEDKPYTIIPIKFRYFKNSICLFGYDCANNVNKNFPINKIQSIKQTPSLAQSTDFGLSTTFKIKGDLKKSYMAKEGENVSPYDDYLIVTNKNEDKEALFKRLLKYGTNCEILYPKTDREKFHTLIHSLIQTHNS